MRTALAITMLLGLTASARADDPQAGFKLEGGEPHAGLPFNLSLIVVGFDEAPTPELPKLDIAGAKVTPLGPQPRVSQSIMVTNGRQSITKNVQWQLRYR